MGIQGAEFIRMSVLSAVQILAKYKALMAQNPIYWAAVILHPMRRTKAVRYNHTTAEAQAIEASFNNFFALYWGDLQDQAEEDNGDDEQPPRKKQKVDEGLLDEFDFIDDPEDVADEDCQAEVVRYFALKITSKIEKGPLAWWCESTQRKAFPRLSRMAIDVLSIPAMSTECERVFSQAKLTMTSQRHRIKASTFEMLQCLKNWLRDGF